MNFVIDTSALCDLLSALSDDVVVINDTIAHIYEGIDALSEGWRAESYMEFRDKAYSYQSSLLSVVDAIRVYRNVLMNKIFLEDITNLKNSLADAYTKLGGE